jgi:N-acetylmuramoyl-L-alanine amidase
VCLAVALIILLLTRTETRYETSGEPTELSFEPVTLESVEIATVTPAEVNTETETESPYPAFTYSKDWDEGDSYLLAKIAMAEAEGESTEGKELVILVVLNRVWSEDFPDTIREVIYEENQFSPVASGRFDAVEPNDDCWLAVQNIMTAQYDYSEGALYFESCEDADNWHSRNLEFLYQCGNHKFYK